MGHFSSYEQMALRWREVCGFVARYGDATPFPTAPETCVEVLSRGNTESEMTHKTEILLSAGAVEVWLVDQNGKREVFDAAGPRADSRYPVTLPAA